MSDDELRREGGSFISNDLFENFQQRVQDTMEGARASERPYERSNTNMGGMSNTLAMLIQQNTILIGMLQQQQSNTSQNNQSVSGASVNDENLRNFHIMPDFSKTIADFSGEKGPQDAKMWLSQIKTTAQLHSWPDTFLFETARSHLCGAAKFWYQSRCDEVKDWSSFKNAFSKTFLLSKTKTELWKEMQSRAQGAKENISVYFHEKIALCKELKLSFEEVKEQIIIGLWSKELSNFLITKMHTDEDDLYQDIVRFERIRAARVERINGKEAQKLAERRTSDRQETDSRNVNSVRRNRKTPLQNEKGEMKCYNCDEYGHISKQCQKEKRTYKCLRCGEEGHTPRYCTKPRPMEKGEVRIISDKRPNTVSKYIKEIELDGKTYVALIDPGSSDCTIKATAAIIGNHPIDRKEMELRGFGNTSNVVRSCGVVKAKNLYVDGVLAENVEIKVVPDDVQPTEVIIGRTFTELSHVVYYKVNDQLRFEDRCNIELPVQHNNSKGQSVKITDNSCVGANRMLFLNAEIGKQTYCIPAINFANEDINVRARLEINEKIMTITEVPKFYETREVKPVEMEELNVDCDVSKEQKKRLYNLMNHYRRCIAKNIYEIGKTDVVEMKIEENPNSAPVVCKPYRATNEDRQKIKKIVEEWKDAGIVQETNSSYASPVLLVTKKNGESRLVVDYRKLNAQTKRINFPLPNLDDHLHLLKNSKIFTTLDLAHGYLQMPLSRESREKTAFITPDETGEFTRTMFGLMNAPFYFSKLMQTVLEPLRDKFVIFYLDDILICAKDWTEMLLRLEQVLELLVKAGLTIKLSKCEFGRRKIEYLGYVISEQGIEPGTRKLDAINRYPVPNDIHELRRFLGMASFFRRFIRNYASIVAPLTKLTRKGQIFQWNEEQNDAFVEVKRSLMSKPVLKMYDPKAEKTELHTDASATGLGAMLLQSDDEGKLHPVYAISRRTSDTESAYHSSKLELLSIVWSVERLRVFLINVKFIIVTDCQALVFLHKNKTKNSQVIRWANLLSDYDYEIRFRRGEQMKHVDALSRAPVEVAAQPTEDLLIEKLSVYSVVTREEEIALFQYSDKDLQRKMDILKSDKDSWTVNDKREVRDYKLKNGLLYKTFKNCDETKDLYVVPKTMRKTLAIKYHDFSGHLGTEKVLRKISEHYYFPKMRNYIDNHVRMCVECILSKNSSGKQPGYLNPIPPGNRPFEIVHMDHLGPFVTTSKGNKYVFAIIDNLTKFVQLDAVKSTKTVHTLKKLEQFLNRFGAPFRVITDRGTSFTSAEFQKFCNKHGLKHTLNSSRHPQANGLVERLNRTILPMMQSSIENLDGSDWDKHIKKLERDINTTINKTTNKSPFELLYGYLPRFEDGQTRFLTTEGEGYRLPQDLRCEVRKHVEKEQLKYKQRYDRHRNEGLKYEVGDIVYMKGATYSTGESTKLQPRYKGPYVVVRVLPSDVYKINRLCDQNGRFSTTAHVSQLKIWRNRTSETEEEEERGVSLEKTSDESENIKVTFKENRPMTVSKPEKDGDRPVRQTKRPKYLESYV